MPGRRIAAETGVLTSRHTKKAKKRSLNALAFAEEHVPTESKSRKNRIRELEPRTSSHPIGQRPDAEDYDDSYSSAKRRKTKPARPDESGTDTDEDQDDANLGYIDSNDDSSVNSDEAFQEEDEERFASFAFRGSTKSGTQTNGALNVPEDYDNGDAPEADEASFSDRATELSMSDAGTGNDAPEKLATLQALATSLAAEDHGDCATRMQLDLAQEAAPPSEYGIRSRQKLSVADLLPTVADPQGRKALRMMAGDGKTNKTSRQGQTGRLEVPLAKRAQDRLDRAAAYEKSKEVLSRWIDTVKYNRRAEHLAFPLPNADVDSAKNTSRLPSTSSAKPITNLDTALHSIVGGNDTRTSRKSQDDRTHDSEYLETNKMPLDEIQARRAELRRNRDLLFREEIRAKRIKKIKSKSFRRVHRKQRERNLLREGEAPIDADAIAKNNRGHLDRIRAEERMSGRHRESKWAKSMKGVGRQAWDGEARNELTEMARRNEELRRRIQGEKLQDRDGTSSSHDSDEGSIDEDEASPSAATTRSHLTKLESSGADAAASRRSALKFMQRATTAQKAQNDEAVEQLRRDLPAEDVVGNDHLQKGTAGRRKYGPSAISDLAVIVPNKSINEFEEQNGSDAGDDNNETVAGNDVSIVTESRPTKSNEPPLRPRKAAKQQRAQAKPSSKDNPWLARPKSSELNQIRAAEEPVLILNEQRTVPGVRKEITTTRPSLAGSEQGTCRKIDGTLPQYEGGGTYTSNFLHAESKASFQGFSPPKSPRSVSITQAPTNDDLIRRAFVSDDVLATSSFAAEKLDLEAEDAEDQDQEAEESGKNLPGWGSWTGVGLPKRDRRKREPPAMKTTMNPKQTTEARNRQMRQDSAMSNVMISQKRVPKAARYLANALPRPFETRIQYERSLRLPVGREWVAGETFREMSRPRVELRAGEVVSAMSRPMV